MGYVVNASDIIAEAEMHSRRIKVNAGFKKLVSEGNSVQMVFILDPEFIDKVADLVNMTGATVEMYLDTPQMTTDEAAELYD